MRRLARLSVLALLASAALVLVPLAGADLADETALAERFAPIVRIVEQNQECGYGEKYGPIDVDLLFDEPTVALRGPWNVCQALALALCVYFTRAAAAAPHPHRGVLRPYQGTPPTITLSHQEYAILKRGEPVYRQIALDDDKGGRGAVVFRVMAPAEIVWSVIFDFSRYPQWVEGVDETEIYRREGDDIYVRFKVRHWLGGSYTYYAHHTYPGASQGWGTWKLDYSRQSDFDDSVGFWRVTPVSGHPRQSDVVYSAELKLRAWVPEFLKRMFANRGLREVTRWLKQQAEARAKAPLK